jgi:hypothetical protein
MEHILQRVTGASRMSMIDSFSGYNQVSVLPEDREKTTFTTLWGTFMCAKMSFGLMNAGATFQRAMDIAFIGEKDKFVVIYLDDITVFSKSFLSKINFLRRFVPNFVGEVKLITAMLKKGNEVRWTPQSRHSFEQIKKALTEAPVLISSNYSKGFLIFSFASLDIVASILLQTNDIGLEHPIAYFRLALRDVEVRYDTMEKQAYALVKALKAFRTYVL